MFKKERKILRIALCLLLIFACVFSFAALSFGETAVEDEKSESEERILKAQKEIRTKRPASTAWSPFTEKI